MIDFRYHLVSLVSVFLALAIGVVLGAGPLRESIGDTLTNQVDALRRDKENLQLAVGNRDEQIQQRDRFISTVSGGLVAGQLSGRSVVLVALPSAGGDAVDALSAEVEAAGATVSGRVTVRPAWVDPDSEAARRSVAGRLAQYLDTPPAADAGVAAELGALLARAVATPDAAQAAQPDPEALTVLESLQGDELVAVDGDLGGRATLVLVATGGVAEDETDRGQGAPSGQDWLPLVQALDAGSGGAVVAGPLSATQPDGLLGLVRAGELSGLASTVDAADTPMGRVTAVLALREQLTGSAGHYGFGEGASAPVPAAAAPAQP